MPSAAYPSSPGRKRRHPGLRFYGGGRDCPPPAVTVIVVVPVSARGSAPVVTPAWVSAPVVTPAWVSAPVVTPAWVSAPVVTPLALLPLAYSVLVPLVSGFVAESFPALFKVATPSFILDVDVGTRWVIVSMGVRDRAGPALPRLRVAPRCIPFVPARHHVGEVVDLTVQKGFKPTYGRYVHAFHQGLTGLTDAIIVSASTSRHNIYAPADVTRYGGEVLKQGPVLPLQQLGTMMMLKQRGDDG